ncbi:hypothetical protein ACA910_021530 [Epithemia clementina (nom. ined.)]
MVSSSDSLLSPRTAAFVSLRQEVHQLRDQDASNDNPTKTFLEALKTEITQEVEKSMQSTRDDIVRLKKALEEACVAKSRANTRKGELGHIKNQLDGMRKQLHRKTSRLQSLEEGRQQRISSMRGETPRSMGILAATESVMNEQNVPLKSVRSSQIKIKTQEETQKDLDFLQTQIDQKAVLSEGKSKRQIEAIKEAVRTIRSHRLESKTSGELGEIKTELSLIKEQLKERDEASKIMQELRDLKRELEKLAEEKSQDEVDSNNGSATKMVLGAANSSFNNSHSVDELSVLTNEMNELKKQLEESHKAAAANSTCEEELKAFQQKFEKRLKVSEGKTWLELHSIKNLVIELNQRRVMSAKRRDADGRDIIALQSEMESMKKQVSLRRGLSARIKHELETMKVMFQEELADVANKSKEEINALKATIEDLTEKSRRLDVIEKREGGPPSKRDLAYLRQNLDSKKQVEERIQSINKQMELRLKACDKKDRKELEDVKKIVEGIDVESFDIWNKEEWTLLLLGVASLKEKLDAASSNNNQQQIKEIINSVTASDENESTQKSKQRSWQIKSNKTTTEQDPEQGDTPTSQRSSRAGSKGFRKRLNSDQEPSRVESGKAPRSEEEKSFCAVSDDSGDGDGSGDSEQLKSAGSLSTISESVFSPNIDDLKGKQEQDRERKLFGRFLRRKSRCARRGGKPWFLSSQRGRRQDQQQSNQEYYFQNSPPDKNSISNDGNAQSQLVVGDVDLNKSCDSDQSKRTSDTDIESVPEEEELLTSTSNNNEIAVNTRAISGSGSGGEVETKVSGSCSTIATPRASNRTVKSQVMHPTRARQSTRGNTASRTAATKSSKADNDDDDGLIDALFAKLEQPKQKIREARMLRTTIDSWDSDEDPLITVYSHPRVPSTLVVKDCGEVETVIELTFTDDYGDM